MKRFLQNSGWVLSPPSSTVFFLSCLNDLEFHSSSQSHGRAKRFALVCNRLVSLVVKASASRAEDPGFESRLRRDFSGSSHTSDLKIGTPVAPLPGAWRYRVSAGTGCLGIGIL